MEKRSLIDLAEINQYTAEINAILSDISRIVKLYRFASLLYYYRNMLIFPENIGKYLVGENLKIWYHRATPPTQLIDISRYTANIY